MNRIWQSVAGAAEVSSRLGQPARALLPHYPVLTVKRLASLLDITVPAASQAVEQLVENKILNERTGYARNRVFAAPDALSIINRTFGEHPILPGAGT